MSIGENIYKYRIAQNRSQSDLAEALNVSRQSVSKWENNTATPDLDKLIKMKQLFGVTLDELVFGEEAKITSPASTPQQPITEKALPPVRVLSGLFLLMFGMIFFLLSVFWGDHLYFGEAFGEFFSAVVVLSGIALLFPYDFRVLSVCSSIYFIYTVISFCVLKFTNISNSLFIFIASIVIVVWFIVCGLHATKSEPTENPSADW